MSGGVWELGSGRVLLRCGPDPAATAAQLEALLTQGLVVGLAAPQEERELAAALQPQPPRQGGPAPEPAEAWAVGPPAAAIAGPAVVVGSGGSSGARRWVLQPLASLEAAVDALAAWLEGLDLDPAAALILNPLPLHHVSGLLPLLRARRWGAELRWLEPTLLREPARLALAEPLDPLRPALISLVPTQLQRLVNHPDGLAWLARCAVIWVGGAALPAPLAECCRAAGLPLAPCYGSSETGAMVCALEPARFLAGDPGVGRPLGHAALAIAPGAGAVRIRAASLAAGSWTAGRLQPLPMQDGWWCSGDRGRLGPAGLELLGRLDGAISSGGETVFPEPVEARLRELAEQAGLPLRALLLLPESDPLWGERLVGLYRPAPATVSAAGADQAAPAPLAERLRQLALQLPPSQRPRRWLACAELAPTALGKWQRGRWRAWLMQQPITNP